MNTSPPPEQRRTGREMLRYDRFKLLRTEQAQRIFEGVRCKRFTFNVEVLLEDRRNGSRIAEVGVRWDDDARSRIRPGVQSWRTIRELIFVVALRRRGG